MGNRGFLCSLRTDQAGAVAAVYAITLPVLIGVAAVGFDYGRMVSLDSELQTAADNAALAAASQLDRRTGACGRAAQAAASLVNNITLMSNTGNNNAITVDNESTCDSTGKIRFFKDKVRTPVTDPNGLDARFVEVHVNARSADYALTPLISAFGSGALNAAAYAGVGTAICRVPPVLMCNPEELASNTNTDLVFDADARKGVGIRLVANDAYTPGSFGFLDTGANGAKALEVAIAWDVRPGECVGLDGVTIKNGVTASVMDAFNVRFDMPGNGQNCPAYGGATGTCTPSVNVRKDQVRTNPNGNGNNTCNWAANASGNADFVTVGANTFGTKAYRPSSATLYPAGTTPQIMGHPRDLCHAFSNVGNCNSAYGGRIGTGDWDIQAYWRSNFNGASYAGQVPLSYGSQPKGYPTRYEVYRWEGDQIAAGTMPQNQIITNGGGNGVNQTRAYAQPQAGRCVATALSPYGTPPGGTNVDRRRISAAVLNCNALKTKYGSINSKVLETAGYADMFLVEPAQSRSRCESGNGCNPKYTEATDVYVEVVGKTEIGGDGSLGQTVRRDVPYLIE